MDGFDGSIPVVKQDFDGDGFFEREWLDASETDNLPYGSPFTVAGASDVISAFGFTIAVEQDVRNLFFAAGMLAVHVAPGGAIAIPTNQEDIDLCDALGMSNCGDQDASLNTPSSGRLSTSSFAGFHDSVALSLVSSTTNTNNNIQSDPQASPNIFTWAYKDIQTTPTNPNHVTALVFALSLVLAVGLGRKPRTKLAD